MKKITQDEYEDYFTFCMEVLLCGSKVTIHDVDAVEIAPSDIIDFMADDPDYSKAIFDAAEKIAISKPDDGLAEIRDSYCEAAEAKLKLVFEQRYIVEKHL